ncbi:uncharacterized protein C10orf67 homolog, mitochondrial isoform X3 [Heterodontus francisci]|uniref:uncharacterized protein C10orf67 homolog, mitochondrial isoform X3 n=1 Tax=Heterodontus francisci TaxID=7792 RepID=UPI00355BB801
MAAVTSPVQSVYSNDQDLVVLLSYSSGDSCFPGAAPSDHLKVGFFKTDRATQTDVSDIVELKELSNAVESLVKEITILKRGVESNTLFLKADYEMKLEQQSSDLYNRMNDYNSYLENMYRQRIEVLRSSFRQQLADAIAKISAEFKKYCEEVNAQNKLSVEDNFTALNMLKQKDSIISSLKARLMQYEEFEQINQINFDIKDTIENEQLVEENEELKEQINFLKENTKKMSETINLNEIQIKELGMELRILKEKSARTESKMQKLFTSEENLKKQLQVEKSRGEQMMEQKEQTSKELAESLKKKEILLTQQMEISSVQKEIPSVEKEACLVAVQENEPVNRNQVIEDLQKLKKIERNQRELIESLNKQLDRTNRMWEKKFAILKQSYHAIKDEMYLRCSLQRQVPTLHCAFTRYTVRDSVGFDFQGQNISPYFPLPQIGSLSAPHTAQTEHNVDRTPSAPSAVNLRSPDNI